MTAERKPVSRREFIKLGLVIAGAIGGAGLGVNSIVRSQELDKAVDQSLPRNYAPENVPDARSLTDYYQSAARKWKQPANPAASPDNLIRDAYQITDLEQRRDELHQRLLILEPDIPISYVGGWLLFFYSLFLLLPYQIGQFRKRLNEKVTTSPSL